MTWQEKLRILIDAHRKGHPTVWIGLSYGPPVDAGKIPELTRGLNFKVPQALSELYEITDGMIIALDFRVGSLKNDAFERLRALNEEFLSSLQEGCKTPRIRLIFGSDGGTGDFLCIAEDGSVVAVDPHWPETAERVSGSAEEFFDDVCMGPGYIRYCQPIASNLWVPVLKEFGFTT